MTPADPTTAVLVAIALFAGHHVGDYLIQSDYQARTKGEHSHHGRKACAGHVATLTLAQLVMLALAAVVTGIAVAPLTAALGLAVNAVSHYWADRRETLRGLVLATEPLTCKRSFYDSVPGGAAHMDQAWHITWIVPSALIIAAPLPLAVTLTAAASVVLATADVASRIARRADQQQTTV